MGHVHRIGPIAMIPRWTIPEAARSGHLISGRAYSKFGGSLFVIFQMRVFGTSGSSKYNGRLGVDISLREFDRNTQERKPVTNSRDTQELLPEAGQEMLRIFHTHPARTSLLQDFAFYEVGNYTSYG